MKKLDYIHYNPVVAGIVEKPEDYLYSSARDYYGLPGLIDILLVEPTVPKQAGYLSAGHE